MNSVFCQSDAEAADLAARRITSALIRALDVSPVATLMVSGGRTPRDILPKVASAAIDWGRITLFASDERCVPVRHADSTEGMVRDLFRAAGIEVNYLAPRSFDQAGADAWWTQLSALPPPAIALLGIGGDGHTASLFPGSAEETVTHAGAVWVPETPPHRHDRITLTAAALARATCHLFVVNSAEKANALQRASVDFRPVASLFQRAANGEVIFTPSANPSSTANTQ